ncbi:SDR family oxidoreductase [Rhizobiaceae bacterium n13]|uniref:SDR family oxidoreductase n=1 Tax=Ferirhizobium litorale TaxID=2927786 RepID=A0AAE3U0M8_9HYPH|nr:SDR family oxidoreductase [Fererhizobium litorale]MDI7861374.1 SDR family oxidoreductase [Fererhizobium litorale]MDI7921521.1 SDR family oxidoreductase [Fererhizobium litorale]
MLSLKNKVAVITGGNSGIGLATAKLFASQGAQVVITGRRPEVVDQAVAEISHGAVGIRGDVADLEHHKALAAEVKERFGGADIYMANAAIINLVPSDMVTPEDYDRQFAINTRGVFFGVQTIAPVLRDGGNIILTSSLAATKVLENHAVYAGTKAAIAAFARNWVLEFKPRGIRVNVLSPGPTDTAILGKLGVTEADRPGFLEMMRKMIPAGRMGEAEELARAALFLASDAASFVNGIDLHVDGGMKLV